MYSENVDKVLMHYRHTLHRLLLNYLYTIFKKNKSFGAIVGFLRIYFNSQCQRSSRAPALWTESAAGPPAEAPKYVSDQTWMSQLGRMKRMCHVILFKLPHCPDGWLHIHVAHNELCTPPEVCSSRPSSCVCTLLLFLETIFFHLKAVDFFVFSLPEKTRRRRWAPHLITTSHYFELAISYWDWWTDCGTCLELREASLWNLISPLFNDHPRLLFLDFFLSFSVFTLLQLSTKLWHWFS